VVRLDLSPLSRDAVALLARGSAVDPDDLHQQTGGNPFFVTEVLAAGTAAVPATVRDAVEARLAHLDAATRDLLEAAAIVGPLVELDLLESVSTPNAGALDEAFSSRFLLPGTPVLSFRHEIARRAIAESIPPARAARLHARILQVLRAPGSKADPARLAAHAEGAGEPDLVMDYSAQAGHRATQLGAYREAAAQFARALKYGAELTPRARAELLDAHAFSCFVSNRLAEAVQSRRQAVELWHKVDDQLREGDSLRWLARCLWVASDLDAARDAVRAALTTLEALPASREFALACSHVAHLHMLVFENAEAVSWAERALRLADALGDVEVRVHALVCMGIARLQDGDDEGFVAIEDAIRLGGEAGFIDHVGQAHFQSLKVMTLQRRHELADRWFERGHAFCLATEHEIFRQFMLAMRARSLLDRGRWQDAQEIADEVLRRAPTTDYRRLEALAVVTLVSARRGRPEARGLLSDLISAKPASSEARRGAWSALELRQWCTQVETCWHLDGAERAREIARHGYAEAFKAGDPWNTGELAYWLWRTGGVDAAPAQVANPWKLQVAGRWQEAAAEWDRLGCPYETARALTESRTEGPLRQALEMFRQLGAKPEASRAARQLRALGAVRIPRGPRAASQASPVGLTTRESEVLELLREDLRNSEIAERLFMSKRTVDHHVAAILAKLGASSRRQAVRAASRLGMTQES
jgi:DNA-binding CsgD family transcriptional regulator/tetratricopeptide (TPR) repeat protein